MAFVLACPVQPLFSSNQNTYVAHAAASLAGSRLGGDWFAGTADPVPVFTVVVRLLMTSGGHAALYAVTLACFGLYFLSLWAIVRRGARTEPGDLSAASTAWVMAAIVALHAFVPDLTRGVADQYLLGSSLQPSLSGILLLAAVALVQRGRYVLAAAALGLAPLVHPTYLLPSLILAIAFAVVHGEWARARLQRPDWPTALAVYGVLFSVTVLAAIISMRGSSAVELAQAQAILVDWRIPHHAKPSVWTPHVSTLMQLAVMGVAALGVRDVVTRRIVAVSLALGVVLTLLTVVTGSYALALLFPWRVSVVLVPVASSILLAQAVARVSRSLHTSVRWNRASLPGAIVVLLLMAAVGATGTFRNFQPVSDDAEHVAARAARDDGRRLTYLIPPRWENFRLLANAPVVVDVKSNPYRPAEVIEWQRRVLAVVALYDRVPADCRAWATTMKLYRADVAIVPAGQLHGCAAFTLTSTSAGYSRYVLGVR